MRETDREGYSVRIDSFGAGERRRLLSGMGLAWLCVLLLAPGSELGPSSAAAEAPAQLWTRCVANSEADTGCDIPRGIAADPRSGHVFVADSNNFRVVEFTALGAFVETWGWDVVASGPGNKSTLPEPAQFEICVPADGDTCKAGVRGAGEGQFGAFDTDPQGIAVDSAGNVFAVDWFTHRVEKFDPQGHFLLTFGSQGSGNGQFSWPASFTASNIAIDTKETETATDDRVYVGDKERIQVFDSEGSYVEDWPDLGGVLAGKTVQSLAVDSSGDLYAIYHDELGIHKLSPSGESLSPTFEIPKLGTVEPFPTAVAVDSAGHVYAFGPTNVTSGSPTYVDPIFEFDPGGNIVNEFGKEEFDRSTGLAINLCPGDAPPGNLYVSNASSSNAFVRAYGPEPDNCGKATTGEASNITETAARLNGKAHPGGEAVTECLFEYGTDRTYGQTAPCVESSVQIGTGTEPVPVHADVGSLSAGTVYHFRLVIGTAGGGEAGSDKTFKTLGPPVLSGEVATRVAYTEATLKALVNPEGFPTKYHFEYGLDATYGHSTPEIEVGSDGDRTAHAVAASLEGLTPGTAYHWRIVASNSSSEKAGPPTEGPDHVFTTYLRPVPAACPNDALRAGAAASLPDCRAYEMVSPVDKNGGGVAHVFEAWVQVASDGEKITYSAAPAFGDVQASVNENQYLASRDPKEGWSNHGIHPPVVGEHPVAAIFFGLFREFEGFSPDLCSAWFLDVMSPPLTPEGQDGYENHYRLDLCGEEAPEALTAVPPPLGTDENYVDLFGRAVAGYSADSRHALFAASAKLDEAAAAGTNAQIYDRFGGGLHLVSIRPNGVADTNSTRIGSGTANSLDNAVSSDGTYVYWTSGGDDGSSLGRIFLRRHPEQGKVEGECGEPAKACTVAVTQNLPTVSAFFWTAAADGSGAVFGENVEGGEKLVEFDLQRSEADPKTARQTIASPVQGVLGASDDLSRLYFVVGPALGSGDLSAGSATVQNVKTASGFKVGQAIEGAGIPVGTTIATVAPGTLTLSSPATASGAGVSLTAQELLTGAQKNSEGDAAQIDRPNLYLDEGGAISEGGALTFVATLEKGDVGGGTPEENRAYNDISKSFRTRSSRVSPDGAHIVFESRAPLTGFDNTDPVSGKALVEVYTYEAGGAIRCVSCNPSGARGSGRELPEPYLRAFNSHPTHVFASAWIPSLEHPLDASHVLSDDGSRLFFNSYDALLPADTNGAMDVYEWEAPGAGSCREESPAFHQSNGGCLYLISSGESSSESEFWDASADGRDVFFGTESSLLPRDPGLVDLYDARVEGGFPEPTTRAECEGEACQSPPLPAQDPTPASANYRGPGDAGESPPLRCGPGKRKVHRHGKARCVKPHKGKHRQANNNRRAAR
jgi:hypothetical protein